jgi:hypothetical protein
MKDDMPVECINRALLVSEEGTLQQPMQPDDSLRILPSAMHMGYMVTL